LKTPTAILILVAFVLAGAVAAGSYSFEAQSSSQVSSIPEMTKAPSSFIPEATGKTTPNLALPSPSTTLTQTSTPTALSPNPTLASSATQETQTTILSPSPNFTPTPMPTLPLDLWWATNWTNGGSTLNIIYNEASNSTPKQTITIENNYDPFGTLVNRTVTTKDQSIDTYGKQANTTKTLIGFFPSASTLFLSPNSLAAWGSTVYPATATFGQSQFARNFTSTVNYENYTQGTTPGNGTYKEEFFGHFATSMGEITFVGNATAPLSFRLSDQVWSNRVEKTSYLLNGKPYAETSVATSVESSYISGGYRLMKESIETVTSFADGSQRTSQITILYQRNQNGVCSGKNGSGTIWGSYIIDGRSLNYTGSIILSYRFNERSGWEKASYSETKTVNSGLLVCVPFEVLFIDDPGIRPVL
jgi:hypothetical protein